MRCLLRFCHFERSEKSLFRLKGEICLRFLTFVRDDDWMLRRIPTQSPTGQREGEGSNFKKLNSEEPFPSQWRRLHDTNQKAPATLSPHPEPTTDSRRSLTRT